MKKEKWASVPGLEGQFKVSDLGRIKSLERISIQPNPNDTTRDVLVKGKILKPWVTKTGYYQIRMWHLGNGNLWLLHRLVLTAFKGSPPEDKPQCLHLDHDKANNNLANLKWGSAEDNIQMDWKDGRRKPYAHWTGTTNGGSSKAVIQFSLDGSLIKKFPSAMEVERQLGISSKLVYLCLVGKMEKIKGFIFKRAI